MSKEFEGLQALYKNDHVPQLSLDIKIFSHTRPEQSQLGRGNQFVGHLRTKKHAAINHHVGFLLKRGSRLLISLASCMKAFLA